MTQRKFRILAYCRFTKCQTEKKTSHGFVTFSSKYNIKKVYGFHEKKKDVGKDLNIQELFKEEKRKGEQKDVRKKKRKKGGRKRRRRRSRRKRSRNYCFFFFVFVE